MNAVNFFVHYGFLNYQQSRITTFVVYVLKNLLYMEFCRYYLKKAGNFMLEQYKLPLMTFLKFFKIILIMAILINAACMMQILVDLEHEASLCKHLPLWMNPIFIIIMVIVYFSLFKWLQQNVQK